MSTDDDGGRGGGTCCTSRQNGIVQPLLTDLYEITMAYAYWKSGKMNDHAVFDLFFRKNPFQGEFTIFAGLEECIKFLNKFHYSPSDIKYLKSTMPTTVDPRFFDYLQSLTARDVTIYAIDEGSVVFPRIPLLRVEGPLIMAQLLETTLLTLVNYASLMATNAARYRMVAGKNITLLEFGLRRAQGPDGGLSASKYSYVGGFDGTSNVLAGKLFNIPVCGTHAHAYITSFTSISDLRGKTLAHKQTGDVLDLLELACKHREAIANDLGALASQASGGELAALISYAVAFPERFTALVDTYDVKSIETSAKGQAQVAGLNVKNKLLTNGSNTHAQNGVRNNPFISESTSQLHKNGFLRRGELGELYVRSGLLNFCAVALALNDLGYKAIGIRIDSGDLAYLSNVARDIFEKIAVKYDIPWFAKLMICASNDINEETIISLNEQSHKIDCFGIGTHLVTCQRQPALGCVYKMVEINDEPRIKLSQEVGKVTIPGRKDAYRLYGSDGYALIDLLQKTTEEPPQVMQKVLCRHPFQQTKRANVTPSRVEPLHKIYWKDGKLCQPLPTLQEIRNRVQESLNTLRNDHKRNLNPTPYKVAISDTLYRFIDELWSQNAPIGELR
ncbi:nicotinate phosphoribosyltransferase isoform X1 [Pogonomyrmex barbatus]|uniref:Nicotinate phosphoribosyltransferase n=1 Tax=Pogonomyrmex barbatus TaxID=144034 RepID=A0A6I9X4R9_9HYME|nr:nicotinate phosphoribosyltransferase isoform X1 [Pogonomyrmex barbatus]XP_011647686.1 nicotinate phosphoribosyltransferase isoform X1 [Pogonomyrmex barbatus]